MTTNARGFTIPHMKLSDIKKREDQLRRELAKLAKEKRAVMLQMSKDGYSLRQIAQAYADGGKPVSKTRIMQYLRG